MAIDSNDGILLPAPPPPRPAARRAAIDKALSRFDGHEETDATEPGRGLAPRRWATLHRRPAGALVAAAVIAIVGIPAIQVALRDGPAPVAEEMAAPDVAAPALPGATGCQGDTCPEAAPDAGLTAANEPLPRPVSPAEENAEAAPPALRASTLEEPAANDRLQDADAAEAAPARETETRAPLAAAPPPPPPAPPPPPPPAQQVAREEGLVVTGNRMRRADESARQDSLAKSSGTFQSPAPAQKLETEFAAKLQSAFRANDRRAIIALAAYPLRVRLEGETRLYRNSADLRRDFDQVFSPDVRQAVLGLNPYALASRDGGRLSGNSRLWFGCPRSRCETVSEMRILEVRP